MTEEKKQQEFVKMETFARWMRVYLPNRQQFPSEDLLPYSGRYIAWAPDGASIAAHADDPNTLQQLVVAAGLDPALCVIEYVEGISTS